MSARARDLNKFRSRIFHALSDPARLEIIDFLRAGEKCVCEIVPRIGKIQPLVSRHLKILKDSGIVKDRKEGSRRFYSIADPRLFAVIDAATVELVDALSRQIVEQIA
jgi:DNA-binding transcriptional ArsR family regulator